MPLKKKKLNSNHLLDDDSEIEEMFEVNWSIESEEEENDDDDDEDDEDYEDEDEDEDDKEQEDYYKLKKNVNKLEEKIIEPDINIEIVKDNNNEKCVQIKIDMNLDNKSKDTISIDFIINKETFLKIAKQLK
jgi:hypothetical protein